MKRTHLLQYVLISILTSIVITFLFLPNWWKNGSINLFNEWYPNLGQVIFYFINFICPVIIYTSLVVLFSLNINLIKNIFIESKNLLLRSITYGLQDVLNPRQFTIQLFFKLLAIVYLSSFTSILWQFPLISERGVIPYKEFAQVTLSHEGWGAFLNYPSIFWINQTNNFILFILISACLIAAFSVFLQAKPLNYLFLWLVHLSIVNFGRTLFHFPWDSFLAEIGFLTVLAVYFVKSKNWLPRIIYLAFVLLYFRQWFSMGMIKLLWGAEDAWFNLTFMQYFWLNQPSPTIIALQFYKLPMFFQNIITLATLLLEVIIPISILFGRRGRILSFILSFVLSFGIQLNGNFGFFNLLTAILGLWCLDDLFFRKKRIVLLNHVKKIDFKSKALIFIAIVISIFNLIYVGLIFTKHSNFSMGIINYYFFDDAENSVIKKSIFETGKVLSRFKMVCPHGVFKGIPDDREQILIYVREEGEEWQLINFQKGNNLDHLYFVAPLMHTLPLKFSGHWSGEVKFSYYYDIFPNLKYLSNYQTNIVKGIFENNQEIGKLIGPIPIKKVEQVKLYRVVLNVIPNSKHPFSLEPKYYQIIDSLVLNEPQYIDF